MAEQPTSAQQVINPKQGEIWYIDYHNHVGSEPDKIRPSVVISPSLPYNRAVRIVVPLTAYQERYARLAWMVLLHPNSGNNLAKPSLAEALLVTAKSLQAFCSPVKGGQPEPLGHVTPAELDDILVACMYVTGVQALLETAVSHHTEVLQLQLREASDKLKELEQKYRGAQSELELLRKGR